MNYISTHNHTIFSFLDGMVSPKEMVERAVSLGMKGIAITDHGNVTGAVEFYKECKKNNINPILGVEAYYVDDVDTDNKKNETKYHMCLLAKSEVGMKSIFNILSIANQHIHYKPRIDRDILFSNAEDIIVTTACMAGIIGHPDAELLIRWFKDRFEDDFYLEIMPIDMDKQVKINKDAVYYNKQYGIKVIATNDAHYLCPEEYDYHNILMSIATKGKFQFSMSGMYLKDIDQIKSDFIKHCSYLGDRDIEEAIENTNEINEKVNINIGSDKIFLPDLGVGDPYEELEGKVRNNLKRFFPYNQEYRERAFYELGVIKEQGFSNYFLIVQDFIRHCQQGRIRLGYGRGSAAGSLVCYLLGITGIDPIKENLLFERFLNTYRVDYPDIDIDVPQSKRKELVEYFKEKYGEENAAVVGTIDKMQTVLAFRDVTKHFNIPWTEAAKITKEMDTDISLYENMKLDANIARSIRNLPNSSEIIKVTEKLTGTFRQAGAHAAGVVIAPDKLSNYGVLEKRKNETIFNWQKDDLEFWGLIKVDILGLSNLDKISDTEALVKVNTGNPVNYDDAPIDKVLEEFGKGNTVGIFQFETANNVRLLRRLSPITGKNILVDTNALGRPGPLKSGMTEKYIQRHHLECEGKSWRDDSVYGDYIIDITKDTKGVVLYQEQVIQILVELAGYTHNEADYIRRIIAKSKGKDEFFRFKEEFVEGCNTTRGIKSDISAKLFDELSEFSAYSFNKSHSAAYTELGWINMILKVMHPKEFMASLFKWTKSESKIKDFIVECGRLNIKVNLPHVNESMEDFILKDGEFRVGFNFIKGIGEKTVENIVRFRGDKTYKSLEDLRLRMNKSQMSTGALRALVLSGACDCFGVNKLKFLENESWYDKYHSFVFYGKGKTVFDYRLPIGMYAQEEMSKKEEFKHKVHHLPTVHMANKFPKRGLRDGFKESMDEFSNFITGCKACSLYGHYKKPIPSTYTSKSQLFILGEAPGKDELKEGKFFVGAAGKKLMGQLLKMGFDRDYIYISNLYKCRPLNNKLKDPPKTCWKILTKEIEIVKPNIILSFGASAMEFFNGQKVGIMGRSGTMSVEVVGDYVVPVVYCIHPASLLYGQDEEKLEIWNRTWDFIKEMI